MDERAVQRFLLRTLLSLPSPILRLMSGGGVVYRGGRTLDPRLQFMAAGAARQPGLPTLGPIDARAASAKALALVATRPEPDVRSEDLVLPGPHGEIPARAYRPERQDPTAPVILYAHMGGGVIGDLATGDAFCRILARIARAPVVSIDYRLAPEHRFPVALDDMTAAYRQLRDDAARFGAPAGHVAVAGDSMGGNLAAVLCQDLLKAGEPQPAFQLLVYPCTDVASEAASMTTYGDAYPLNRATMDWFMGHYLGPQDDPADPRLSPLRASDLAGLAPAIVAAAGFDPLLDQGKAYARALQTAGVRVVYRCYDSLAHGFTAFTGAVPAADGACRDIAGLVRDAIEGRVN